jgi:trk system potassium uptake protein TrkH
MPVFDSLCYSFGTLATGGFSTKNASLGYYSSYCQWVTIVFMFLAGANFALHYTAWQSKSFKGYVRSPEFRTYTFIVLGATLLVMWNIRTYFGFGEELIRAAFFQVVTIITTTGFATTDFNLWPDTSRLVLLTLMLIGGCAGSTAGAIKVGRLSIMTNQSRIELRKMIHPRAVIPLKSGNAVINQALLNNVLEFFFLYFVLIVLATIVMSSFGIDLVTSLSAVISCLGNVGPGFGQVGPMSNYSMIPGLGKVILSVLMLLGRLEIFILLILLVPEYWRR